MYEATNNDNKESNELSKIYKIFKVIYLKAIPVLKDLSHNSIEIDYREWINDKNNIDFNRIEQKFQDKKYSSITDAIQDIRLVFLNCYTFYGTKSDYTKGSLKLEELFEQEISCLNENIKPLADIQLTLNLLNLEENSNFKFRYPKDCYDSILLRRVAHCRPYRLKEYHKKLSSMLTNDDDNIHTLDEITCWENTIYFNKNYQCISSMWELPEIGNFMAIIFKAYDIDIITQTEIERMFLMPKESTTMSKIMTVLLMPIKRSKVIEQIMPYSVWSKKLSKKVSEWYKVYYIKNRNKVNVMTSLGIHPDFWTIVGDKNPLVEGDYCELSYFMKVWLIKGLCDHITIKYKIINDLITNCNERQCTIWKNDTETEEYFFFNSMPDLRIYYHNITYNEPNLEFLEMENSKEEKMSMNEILSIIGIPSIFYSESRKKHDQGHFKLIADSVQGLRSFLEKLDVENTSAPDNLITSLENLIIKIEHEECNLIILNYNSIIRLFKDWKSYSERTNKDITVLRGRREFKSISQGLHQENILEKRKRKVVVKQGFDSDDCFTETNVEDYTDSEDEWGAMNQPKNKSKKPFKTQSKLLQLEKRLKKGGKIPKPCKKRALGCGINNKLFKTNENENELNDEKQKENKLRDTFKTNTLVNGHNEKLNCSDIINNSEQIQIENISSGEEVISTFSKMEENKNACKNQNYIIESDNFINTQPDLKNMRFDISEDVEIVTIEDDKLDDCKIIEKDSSENIVNDINEQNHCMKIQSAKYNLKNNVETISIEDYEEIDDCNDDVQFVSVTSLTQNTSMSSGTQNISAISRKQNTTMTLRTQNSSITPRTQNISDTPRTQNISATPRTQNTSNVSRTQNTAIVSRTQNTSRNCRTKNTSITRRTQNISDTPRTQNTTMSSGTQNTSMSSGTQNISAISRKQNTTMTSRTQNSSITPRTQNISDTPRTQNISVTLRTQNTSMTSITQNTSRTSRTKNTSNASRTQNTSITLGTQNISAISRKQNTTMTSRTQNSSITPRTQNISDTPRTQNTTMTSRTLNTSMTSITQNTSRTSRTKNTSNASRTQNTSITLGTQNSSITPRTQNISDTPRTQNTTMTSRTLNSSIVSRTQNSSRTTRTKNTLNASRTQNTSRNYRTKNISITPRTQNMSVTPRSQNSYITPRIQNLPVNINRSFSLNNSFNKSQSSTFGNKQMTTTNFTKNQVITTSMPKPSPDNVHLSNGIEVTMIKEEPPTIINSHFSSIKRSTTKSNGYPINNPSFVNVKCKIMSEPNHKGEVTFYVSLPNGKKHNVSDELMNQYLKEHNNRLPDYWLVPLPIEVAKQYGFH